jgi:hypothetical protein
MNDLIKRLREAFDSHNVVEKNLAIRAAHDRLTAMKAAGDGLAGFAQSIMHQLECDPGNAPGHGHTVPGVWDIDRSNGEKGGKPCEWCAEWSAMKSAIKQWKEASDGV